MEKYTNWRDKGTGIAPFLPPSLGSPSVVSKVSWAVLSALKTIVVSPMIILYLLTGSKALFKVIALFLFGWKVDVTVQGVKRRQLNKREHYPHESSVYLCNSSSAIDAHVLDSISNGKSIFLVASDNQLYKMNRGQYMDFTLDGSLDVKRYGKEIHSIDQCKGQVTFIFPEGTCSNGKSVLPFEVDETRLGEMLAETSQVQVIHLKINEPLTTPLSLSKWQFVSRMMMYDVHAKVKIHESQPLRPLESLRVAMNDGNKFKLVSKALNVEAKKNFVETYEKR